MAGNQVKYNYKALAGFMTMLVSLPVIIVSFPSHKIVKYIIKLKYSDQSDYVLKTLYILEMEWNRDCDCKLYYRSTIPGKHCVPIGHIFPWSYKWYYTFSGHLFPLWVDNLSNGRNMLLDLCPVGAKCLPGMGNMVQLVMDFRTA